MTHLSAGRTTHRIRRGKLTWKLTITNFDWTTGDNDGFCSQATVWVQLLEPWRIIKHHHHQSPSTATVNNYHQEPLPVSLLPFMRHALLRDVAVGHVGGHGIHFLGRDNGQLMVADGSWWLMMADGSWRWLMMADDAWWWLMMADTCGCLTILQSIADGHDHCGCQVELSPTDCLTSPDRGAWCQESTMIRIWSCMIFPSDIFLHIFFSRVTLTLSIRIPGSCVGSLWHGCHLHQGSWSHTLIFWMRPAKRCRRRNPTGDPFPASKGVGHFGARPLPEAKLPLPWEWGDGRWVLVDAGHWWCNAIILTIVAVYHQTTIMAVDYSWWLYCHHPFSVNASIHIAQLTLAVINYHE